MRTNSDFIRDALLGIAVGDALGVPVEFNAREILRRNPVTDMRAFGSHHQPAGTWSDDSALAFCLAEMLCNGYDLRELANSFVKWKEHGYWSAHGRVFDIGIATTEAIYNLQKGGDPLLAGGTGEYSNGNGSLMRILPLLFYIADMPLEERYRHVAEVSSLTHRHIRSLMGCFIVMEFARLLLRGSEKHDALATTAETVRAFFRSNPAFPEREIAMFTRILDDDGEKFRSLSEENIRSGGYVVHTLEAAIWCLLQKDNYADTVLLAVNLGDDTDTTAAVAGGLAGLLYGLEEIPQAWLDVLARRADIEDLAHRLHLKTAGANAFTGNA